MCGDMKLDGDTRWYRIVDCRSVFQTFHSISNGLLYVTAALETPVILTRHIYQLKLSGRVDGKIEKVMFNSAYSLLFNLSRCLHEILNVPP